MVKPLYIPERGDIVWLDLNPTRGHEQKGIRPTLVLSSRAFNQKIGLGMVCPITSRAKGYPFEVGFTVPEFGGVVLVDQLRTVDWRERTVRYESFVGRDVLAEVQHKVMQIIVG